ncbi:hypothetical protein WJX74_004141 [Apatococcus lobatus]|uniref:Uncharacterized protein n=1 Tax=Apatococcus lobatus TaxID=904363 RepID=A0AAW1RIU0_9CHLO
METVKTKTEGIFVMPESRINILSTYVYTPTSSTEDSEGGFLHASSSSTGRRCARASSLADPGARSLHGGRATEKTNTCISR